MTIKAIIELKFNPGKGVAHLSLAGKGLSIMACPGMQGSPVCHRDHTPTGRAIMLVNGEYQGAGGQFLGIKNEYNHIYVPCVGSVWAQM
jgi:hypothetical protein